MEAMVPEKRGEALSIINYPATRLPGPSLLHDLVHTSTNDSLPAIEYLSAGGGRSSMSYRDLHRISERTAQRISAIVSSETSNVQLIVPVLIPQCPVLYASLLAILKAGGAFCPLNIDTPPERARFIFRDVSARIVLTTAEVAANIPNDDEGLTILVVDTSNDDDTDNKRPSFVSHRQPGPSDLAYVMYTSGSTGTPKGVGVSHEAATQSLLAHDRHIPSFSRFLQFAAPTFDVSVFEIFFPLFKGKTLVSCNRPDMLNDLPSVIREMDVDACELTPTVAGSLVRTRDNAPCLRLLLTIGEMLTRPIIEEFGGSEGQKSILWAMYGPTEAAIHCTLQPAFAKSSTTGDIGFPLDSVSVFVLEIQDGDEANAEMRFQILRRGDIGELAVGGYQLAHGYLNRPEQTAAAFINTPYGRLYRTGDKVRLQADGTLECLGRISEGQVKLRGQRVELGEIEHAALRTPGCHGAFAAVIMGIVVLFCATDTGSNNKYQSYGQQAGQGSVESEIWRSCKEWLPGFMVPGDIVVMHEFPRLDSGKIDRKSAVAMYSREKDQGLQSNVKYRDVVEEQLCDSVRAVLGIGVSPYQDLSKVGMESLNSIRLASKLRQAGYNVTAIDILTSKTISSLRARITSQRTEKQGASRRFQITRQTSLQKEPLPDIEAIRASIPNRSVRKALPCTPLQAAMLAETVSNTQAYCNWVEIRFSQSHGTDSIMSWIFQLADKNEILRTGFFHNGEGFVQVVFESLEASQVSVAEPAQMQRNFEMHNEGQFLRPFRAHIFRPGSEDGATVLLQIHHAVYDGWSMDAMLADLSTLSQGKQLVPRPQFCQVAAYYQSEEFAIDCDNARGFWAGTLAGVERGHIPHSIVEIPSNPGTRSQHSWFSVSPQTAGESLRESLGCEVPMLFQAAVTWLWGALIGTEDVVIGSITSGRTLPISGIENVIGPCISAVPLRTDLAQLRTIADLLRSIHESNRALLPHSILPLSDIRKAAGIRPGQTLYDILFVYQKSLYKSKPSEGVYEVSHQDYLETKLLVEVEPEDDRFCCQITYHAGSFSDTHVGLMLEQLQTLVTNIIKNLDSELALLQTVFPDEMLSHYNQNPESFRGVPDLALAFEDTARRFSSSTALCFAHELSDSSVQVTNLSFAELDSLANRIAWRLKQSGVRPGAVVAIVMEKSILLYAGILGILKNGCAYLPLLPSTPIARVQAIFDTAAVRHAVVDSATKRNLEGSLAAYCLDDLEGCDFRLFPDTRPNIQPDPSRIAYVVYTSGSTGVPKGVCVTQLNIMSNIDVLSKIYPVRPGSRLLQSCSQAFDVSVFEIFFAWRQGMCLCSAVNDVLFQDVELSIRKLNITHLSLTPTVASLVHPENVPSVEFLVTAGEAMTEAVAQKWHKQLYQGYGPSETTNICSVKKMGQNQVVQHLGWAFKNTSAFVLFKDSVNLAPLGCFGELCFGGDQIAQGYLNMPELSASKFLDHPALGRIYRSGDLGRMLPDGSMVIAGRLDEQIKIRGQRTELGEITATVKQSGQVSEAVTILIEADSSSASAQLVTFFVPRPAENKAQEFDALKIDDGMKSRIAHLYQLVISQLPAYMVPSYLVPISTVPFTASGKLDRACLRSRFRSLARGYLELISPRARDSGDDGDQWSQHERRVADTVSTVFHTFDGTLGKWTPLTILGLDSISAIRLSKALQTTFGRRIPVSAVLKNPTVARLAQLLDLDADISNRPSRDLRHFSDKFLKAIRQRANEQGKIIDKILPCTPLQEAMLVSPSGRGSYLNRMLFRLYDDPQKMKAYWAIVCQRHGILRSCFVTTDDAQHPIAQIVLRDWAPKWLEFGASAEGVNARVSEQAEALPSALDCPTVSPVVSLALIRDDSSAYLSFLCHHALYDGVAMGRLLFEVEQLAAGNNNLPSVPAFDSFLREALSLPPSSDEFWKEQLRDFSPKLLPRARHISQGQSTVVTHSARSSLPRINERVKQLGVSLLALCQSAWALVLSSILKTEHVCFGNVVSGRSLPIDGIEELVAPCFNTIPVLMNLSERKRNIDIMRAFQNANTELLEYQFTPLRRIQALLSHKSSPRLFDTLLLLQQPSVPLNQRLWSVERDEGEMDFPLACELTPNAQMDKLFIKLHSQPGYYSSGFLDGVSDMFSVSLQSLLDFPASQALRLPLPESLTAELLEIPQEDSADEGEASAMATNDSGLAESWSEIEEGVRSVLANLSAIDQQHIRRDTTIYQLGLDSISVVRVASLLRERGYGVSATDVIENPTCESLARCVEDSNTSGKTAASVAYDLADFRTRVHPQVIAYGINADDVETVLPCTPIQVAMLAQFVRSEGRDYLNFVDYSIDRGVDASSLAQAWKSLHAIHPILRTGFVPVEHEDASYAMVQYLAAHNNAPVVVVSSEHGTQFNIEKWRLDASHEVAKNLHLPPWQIVCVDVKGDVKGGTTMHLAIHHALYDAYSLRILLSHLANVLLGSKDVPQPIRSEDGVMDLLGQTKGWEDEARRFWKTQSDRTVVNRFPTMTPLREETREILSDSIASEFPLSALETAAKEAGYTMQVILQSAWARLLSSYLGESSIVFGVVLSGRTTDATRDAMLPCITTLPVIAENVPSNAILLRRMLEYNTGLFKYQHTRLERIQQWLGCADTRLFDTLLVYQRYDGDSAGRLPWKVTNDIASVDYPVSIEVEPGTGDRLEYRMTFYNDILPAAQARLLMKQLDRLVHHLALNPDSVEAEIYSSLGQDLVSIRPPELLSLPSRERFLHEFVELRAHASPEKTALTFVDGFRENRPVTRQWTYRELDENGNRAANLLLPHAKVADIVAVYFDKSPEAFFSILGVLKAGCSFVALDPGAPPSRKEFIVRDSRASLVLTSLERSAELDFLVSVPVIGVDLISLAKLPADPVTLQRDLSPGDGCYCLYTSGTTGTPKGCEITHENAVQAMLAFQRIFEGHWNEDSRWLQFASFHFDVSVLEQYWSWSVGITLVAATRNLILEDLAGMISRLEITHIDLTPSLARLLHPDDVPSLCRGVFITGGEALKQEILDVWGSKAVIYNFYGPTEATIGVTVFPRVPQNGRSSNIGKQFINVGSYVLKPGTETPVPRGGVGELCVSGKLVGKGYLNRDDLTAERFPTLRKFSERVYRTGDLVRMLHDGCFDFLGRADDQVKLRGQRLEIGEINHTIRTYVEHVHDVVTLVIRNEKQQKDILVSFVVTDPRPDRAKELQLIDGSQAVQLCQRVQSACRSRLPGYMVPTYVLQLPFIPLSSNNKAEVKELKNLFNSMSLNQLVSSSSSGTASSKQFTATGETVRRALASMQNVDPASISPSSSIFELGIDSISALRFSLRLKRARLNASPAIVLRHPVLWQLADALDAERSRTSTDSPSATKQIIQACHHKHVSHVCKELGIQPDQIDYIAPCSPLQQGMISRSSSDTTYFNTFRFELARDVQFPKLRDAWAKVISDHAILRTGFVETVDGVVQVALKTIEVPWSEVETPLSSEELERLLAAEKRTWVESNRPDVRLPLQLLLVRSSSDSSRPTVLVLHIFHGLYDAASFGLILDTVAATYSVDSESATPSAVSGPSFLEALQYGPLRDFSSCKPFWVEHLRGHLDPQPLLLTTSPVTRSLSCMRTVACDKMEQLRTALGVTHQAIVQAAWVAVLGKRLGVNPTIGIILSGRHIELDGVENTIGPLFNTVPFHGTLAPESELPPATWEHLVRSCHEFNTSVLSFQHVPLRDLQKWCSAGKPLFNTLLSLQRERESSDSPRKLWTELEPELNPDYPLALEVTLTRRNELRLFLVARGGVADEQSLTRLLDAFEVSMSAMIEDAGSQIVREDDKTSELHQLPRNGMAIDSSTDRSWQEDAQPSQFGWNRTATLLRKEMALLADIPEEQVTETTPLFELGLDSIDIIKLSARLRKSGVILSTALLMKRQTISACLEAAEEGKTSNRNVGGDTEAATESQWHALRKYVLDSGVDLSENDVVLPPTPLQDGMVAEMISSDFRKYFNQDILKLGPGVDVGRFLQAWRTVIRHSPILRTTFHPVDSPSFEFAYCQITREASPISIDEVDLDSTDGLAGVMGAATNKACRGHGARDLLQLVLANIRDSCYLVLSLAHALYDGWSLALLHQDVQSAYYGQYKPREPYEPYLHEIVESVSVDASDFWAGFLDGAVPTMVSKKTDLIASQDGQNPVNRAEAASSVSLATARSFCKQQGVTMQVLGQACWAALLGTRTKCLDVSFGVVLSGRDSDVAETLMFPTMNTVAVRSIFHSTVSVWLRYLQQNMASITQYQHFPLRKAQRAAGSAAGPLFNTLFVHQRQVSSPQGSDEPLMRSVDSSAAAEYPVCVEMEVLDSGLVWRTACDPAYLTAQETSFLLHQLDVVLDYILSSPDAEVLSFSGQSVSVCCLPSFPPRVPITDKKAGGNTSSTFTGQRTEEDNLSPLEDKIMSVLSRISGIDVSTISRSHTIYHLGLDSISVIKTSSLLRKDGVLLHPRELLSAGSVAEMAELAAGRTYPDKEEEASKEAAQKDSEGIDKLLHAINYVDIMSAAETDQSAVEEVIPATAMQAHMLSAWQNSQGGVFYPEFRYRVAGVASLDILVSAWKILVEEMPILRTSFVSTGVAEVPFLQIVFRPAAQYYPQQSSATGWTSTQECQASFDTSFASLSAALESQGFWRLSLKIHHALYDGVSLPLMMSRFRDICASDAQRRSDTEQSASTWKRLVSNQFADTSRRARKDFWTSYLSAVQSTPFPPCASSSVTDTRISHFQDAAFRNTSALQSRCTAAGISVQALFFAAYAKILASSLANTDPTTGTKPAQDVVFGIYLASRDGSDGVDELPYPTLALVPIRVRIGDGSRLSEIAARIQDDLRRVSDPKHVGVGLWEIKDWTGVVVHLFVNFLSMADRGAIRREAVGNNNVVLEALGSEEGSAQDSLFPARLDEPGAYHRLFNKPNVVREAYPDAVDIEVAVRAERMSIGVFGPGSVLGKTGAGDIVSGVVAELAAF